MLKQKIEHNASKGVFDIIPEDITKYTISTFFNAKEHSIISLTNSGVRTLFKESFDKIALNGLLQAIVDENEDKVKQILNKEPELLLKKPDNHLVIESKLTWQQFHSEEPLKMAFKRNQLEMVKLILPYFDKIKDTNGKQEASKQLEACTNKTERYKQYVLMVKTAIKEINTNTFSISDFRKKLLLDEVIVLDNYVDVEALLLAAYRVYAEEYVAFTDWPQRDEFCIKVIGFLQRLLIPETAKVFCQGLHDVVEKKQLISDMAKSLKLVNNDSISYYPSVPNSSEGLGFSYLINDVAQSQQKAAGVLGAGYSLFEKLYQSKMSALNRLKNDLVLNNLPKNERFLCEIL